MLLPTVRSVGVMGDQRTYERTLVLRAVGPWPQARGLTILAAQVQTTDFMTADWYQMPYHLLGRISTRIINECKGINRVVYVPLAGLFCIFFGSRYDVSSKPPATIEWE